MIFRMKTVLISGLAAASLAGLMMFARTTPAQTPTTQPAAQASTKPAEPSGKVVATVNGEPISESQLLAALPEDAFEAQLESLKKAKLERLIDQAVLTQFLKRHDVTVPDSEVDKGLVEFKQMITAPGCSCCGGGYASLEQFMKSKGYTTAELRQRVSGDIGLRLYVDRLAKEMTSPQALADATKKRRPQIEADFIKGATISFEFYQDPNYFRDAKAVEARKEKLANEAWQRLQKGDAFDKVAKEMSEDKVSAPKGGRLGCVRADYLGREIDAVWRKLEPGTYSKPIKTNWGYCVVTREELSDDDILSVLKEQAKSLAEDQVYQEFKAAREGAKITSGPDAALPSTAPASKPNPD